MRFENFKTMADHLIALGAIQKIATVESVEHAISAEQAASIQREIANYVTRTGDYNAVVSVGDSIYGTPAAFLTITSQEGFLAGSFREDGSWYGDNGGSA
jgi:hypothetical protein